MLLGLDVGGTFTDAVIIDAHRVVATAKRRTTKDNLMNGIGEALDAVLEGYDTSNIEQVTLSTTVVTNTIVEAKGATRHCSICFNLSAQDPCEFCSNPNRDQTTIMVVETSRDVIAIERSGDYKGLYHVLEGALSPMEGIGADDIRVKELIARLRDGVVQEVILATDPDVEGEATALYLARLLSPSGIKVTRIARGVPVGGDIEYADELTLGGAVVNRQEMKG